MIVSFIFSLLGTFLFMKILKKIKVKNSIFIPLVGIMLGNIIDSITTFLHINMILFKVLPLGFKVIFFNY